MDILELFYYMLSKKSITPDDGGLLDFVASYLDDYEVIRLDKNGVKNLFLYKKFGDGEHLCFAGHVDVVPPGEGWMFDPFTPVKQDGYIYARGVQDMKSGVAAFIQALKDTTNFNGTLSVLLTSDEEGDAKFGTKVVLEYLKENNLLPKYAVVAEPTCEEVFGDIIKVGRRGSINGYLNIYGKQGHAAYPHKAINPIHLISSKLDKLAGIDLDNGDKYFAPSKMVLTDIRGGMEVTNVTPENLKIMFNVRNNTKTNQQSIKKYIEKVLDGLKWDLKLTQGSYPFITNTNTKIVKNLDLSIVNTLNIKPKYSTAGGTSDARFLAQYGVDVVEFGVKNDTIHAVNERVGENEVIKLYEIFKYLIKTW